MKKQKKGFAERNQPYVQPKFSSIHLAWDIIYIAALLRQVHAVYLLTNRTWKMSPQRLHHRNGRKHIHKRCRMFSQKMPRKKRVVAKKQASHRLHGFTLLEVRSMTLFANDCYSATAEDWRQIQIITILRKRSSSCWFLKVFLPKLTLHPFISVLFCLKMTGLHALPHIPIFSEERCDWGMKAMNIWPKTCSTGATEMFLPCARPMVLEDRPRPKSKTTPKGKRCSQYSKP